MVATGLKVVRWALVVGLLGAGPGLTFGGEPAAELEKLLETRSVSEWTEMAVDSTRDVGAHLDVAVVNGMGVPYVSYYDAAEMDLWFARYVESGGNCGGGRWQCQLVEQGGDVGRYNSISVTSAPGGIGVAIAYYYHDDLLNQAGLKVAEGVCTGTCTFTTHVLEQSNPTIFTWRGLHTSITHDLNGHRHISYQVARAFGNEELRYAFFVGPDSTPAGNCGQAPYYNQWYCMTIVSGEGVGEHSSVVTDFSVAPMAPISSLGGRRPSVAYYDSSLGEPWLATMVGAGGSGNCGPSNSWFCTSASIDLHDAGRSVSVMVEPYGAPHMAFLDATTADLVYASYVGYGGDCGCSILWMDCLWRCRVIENVGQVGAGRTVALAADQDGQPMIAYRDASGDPGPPVLRFAQPRAAAPAGAVPNCGPLSGGPIPLPTWVCTTLDAGGAYAHEGAAVAIDSHLGGTAIAYHELDTYTFPEEGALKVLLQLTPYFADGFESGDTGAWSATFP